MRAWLSLCVALCVSALSGAAHALSVRAPSEPVQCESMRQTTLALADQFWKPSHETALRAFSQQIPAECVHTRAYMDRIIASVVANAQWRMLRDGVIVEAPPPPDPQWLNDREVWPRRLSSEMMVRSPNLTELRRLHPERAEDREQVGAVTLEGRVREDGSLTWRVVGSTLFGWGFEEAALRAGALYEAPLHFEDGRSTLGAAFIAVVVFDSTRRPIYYD